MKELSLNILDIAENSFKARASLVQILLDREIIAGGDDTLTLRIIDDGCGMDAETVRRVTDPFYTTRTTRPVGMGLSLLKLAAEQTGGHLTVESVSEKDDQEKHGTTVTAVFHPGHIDSEPLGDVVSTVVTLVQGHPDTDLLYVHSEGEKSVELDTRQLREVLGDVPLGSFEVLQWIEGYLREQYEESGIQV